MENNNQKFLLEVKFLEEACARMATEFRNKIQTRIPDSWLKIVKLTDPGYKEIHLGIKETAIKHMYFSFKRSLDKIFERSQSDDAIDEDNVQSENRNILSSELKLITDFFQNFCFISNLKFHMSPHGSNKNIDHYVLVFEVQVLDKEIVRDVYNET